MPLSDWSFLLLPPPPCRMPLSDWSLTSLWAGFTPPRLRKKRLRTNIPWGAPSLHPDALEVEIPIIDSINPRPNQLPLAVPEDLRSVLLTPSFSMYVCLSVSVSLSSCRVHHRPLSFAVFLSNSSSHVHRSRLERFHASPPVWWIGQLLKFLLKPKPKLAKLIQVRISVFFRCGYCIVDVSAVVSSLDLPITPKSSVTLFLRPLRPPRRLVIDWASRTPSSVSTSAGRTKWARR